MALNFDLLKPSITIQFQVVLNFIQMIGFLTAAELARVTRVAARKATNTTFILTLSSTKDENVPGVDFCVETFVTFTTFCRQAPLQAFSSSTNAGYHGHR